MSDAVLSPAPEASAPPAPSPAEPPKSPITVRAVAAGLVLSVMLCAMNSYLTLSFGVIEEGPTIAALVFFAFFFWTATKISVGEMVVVSTMGSAGGSFGFIANFYAAKSMTGVPFTFWQMVAFGLVSSLVGMVMVVPLRQMLILRDNLPWPGSKAVQSVITALVEHGDPKQPKYLLITFLSMLLVVVGNQEDGFGWWPTEIAIPGLAAWGAAIAWSSPFSMGGSYLMGLRTCVGFLFGAIALMVLGYTGIAPEPDAAHHYYWPGLGFLVASGLTSMALNGKTIVEALGSLMSLGKGGSGDDDPMLTSKGTAIFGVVTIVAATAVLVVVFDLSLVLVVILIAIGGLVQNVIATRAAAQTAFNPARVMGILLQGLCSAFGGSAAATNLAGAGFVAGSGAQAGLLTGDLVYGRWLKVPSRYQFWTQVLTIIPAVLVSAWVFQHIDVNGALSLSGGKFSAPVAKMWAQSALMFEKGKDALPPGALTWLLIGGAVGIVYTLAERVPLLLKWLPDSIGVGLGMVLSVSTGITFFLGGVIMWIILPKLFKAGETTLTTIAVGSIVAEGIGGVLKPGLISIGLIHH
jgi:uncharacterized oligopeptide transporter (OPT) family protein